MAIKMGKFFLKKNLANRKYLMLYLHRNFGTAHNKRSVQKRSKK